MNLEITLNNGSKFYPSFEPSQKNEVMKFYLEEFFSGRISDFRIL
jgi:hypothetical protein